MSVSVSFERGLLALQSPPPAQNSNSKLSFDLYKLRIKDYLSSCNKPGNWTFSFCG
jgi:hypothetical protein